MQIDLTPFPKREGGIIQSLSPFRREVKIVPHWVDNCYNIRVFGGDFPAAIVR